MKRHFMTGLFGIALMLCHVTAGADSSGPAETAHPAGPSRVALMVFIDYEDHVRPSLTVSELRFGGAHHLGDWLRQQGKEVLTYPEIEPIMRAQQVRSPLDMPAELLHALATEHAVEFVMVARLVVYRDRILLLARGLTANEGILCWAGTAERPIPADFWTRDVGVPEAWGDLVAAAGDALHPHWPTAMLEDPTPTPTLVFLPLRAIGLGAKSADIATYSLLGSLLRTNRWKIPDPGLVQTVLQAKGHDPDLLDEAGRSELALRFDSVALLAPELIPFESLEKGTGYLRSDADADDADVDSGTAARTPIALIAEAKVPLYLQTLLVDCRTGQVQSALATYLEPDDPTRLFGFVKRIPLSRRFEHAADQIVQEMKGAGGKLL